MCDIQYCQCRAHCQKCDMWGATLYEVCSCGWEQDVLDEEGWSTANGAYAPFPSCWDPSIVETSEPPQAPLTAPLWQLSKMRHLRD